MCFSAFKIRQLQCQIINYDVKLQYLMMKIYCLLISVFVVLGQLPAQYQNETHVPVSYKNCVTGTCVNTTGYITLDLEWRWKHLQNSYTNCNGGNYWNCPNALNCTQTCVIEGLNLTQYNTTYGITPFNNGIKMQYVTGGNVGSRVYLMKDNNTYLKIALLNQEISFTVDLSTLPCGVNGAVYLIEAQADGGTSAYPNVKAGAKYGEGYCDAQCPQLSFVGGLANSPSWGSKGACCNEFDLLQANKQAEFWVGHPCKVSGYAPCNVGSNCSVCDGSGCGMNPYRLNNKKFWAPGSTTGVDTSKPFTVVTQFKTKDGTNNTNLSMITRFYVQNGKQIKQPNSNWTGLKPFNNMSDASCQNQSNFFGDSISFIAKGGLAQAGAALKRGVVPTMAIWDDYVSRMQWMDGTWPTGSTAPGSVRGPCNYSQDDPNVLRSTYPTSYLGVYNFAYGKIGSTTGFL